MRGEGGSETATCWVRRARTKGISEAMSFVCLTLLWVFRLLRVKPALVQESARPDLVWPLCLTSSSTDNSPSHFTPVTVAFLLLLGDAGTHLPSGFCTHSSLCRGCSSVDLHSSTPHCSQVAAYIQTITLYEMVTPTFLLPNTITLLAFLPALN